MTRKEILDNAARIVGGKDGQHGSAENNFDKIARLWYAYKGVPFTSKDVAVMMILLKVARIASGHQDIRTTITGQTLRDMRPAAENLKLRRRQGRRTWIPGIRIK